MKAILARSLSLAVAGSVSIAVCLAATAADEAGWVDLIGEGGFDAWRKPTNDWILAGNARPDPKNNSRLLPEPGHGTIVNGAKGKTGNLYTKQEFRDVEAHVEFQIPKGSNSGVKFETLYEIQIDDSFGIAKPTASHCGGIYPRAEMLPRYHHIDDGVPPRVNAAREPGQWQTLDVIFRAPRFDAGGNKVKNARFEKVVLNGQLIHQDVELKTPTGHVWRLKEVPSGPILLQGDHGPVAFRNIRVKALD